MKLVNGTIARVAIQCGGKDYLFTSDNPADESCIVSPKFDSLSALYDWIHKDGKWKDGYDCYIYRGEI